MSFRYADSGRVRESGSGGNSIRKSTVGSSQHGDHEDGLSFNYYSSFRNGRADGQESRDEGVGREDSRMDLVNSVVTIT